MSLSLRTIAPIAVLAIAAVLSFPQNVGGASGPVPNYDPRTETTVAGTIERISDFSCQGGKCGLHLALRSSHQTYAVHVGPSSYLAENGFDLAVGEQVEITGPEVRDGGTTILIAKVVTKGARVYALWDGQGYPVWAGERCHHHHHHCCD